MKRYILSLMILLLILSGCSYVADENYSVPNNTNYSTPLPTEKSELSEESQVKKTDEPNDEVLVSSKSSDEYILKYVNKIYTAEEEYDYYFADPNSPETFAIDLNYKVKDFRFDDELSPDFDYLNNEDKTRLSLNEDEIYAYFTLEITAGKRHVNETVNVGGMKLMESSEDGLGNIIAVNVSDDEPCFEPVEFYDTKDSYCISIKSGETKELCYVSVVDADIKDKEVYLRIDTFGLNLFDEEKDPKKLTEEEKNGVGVFKLQGEIVSEGQAPNNTPSSKPVSFMPAATYPYDWFFDCLKEIKPGESYTHREIAYAEDGITERVSVNLTYTFDGAYATKRVDMDTSINSGEAVNAIDSEGNISDGYIGIVAEWTVEAGEKHNGYQAPVRAGIFEIMFRNEDKFKSDYPYTCSPNNPDKGFWDECFVNRELKSGESTHLTVLYVVPENYYNESDSIYILGTLTDIVALEGNAENICDVSAIVNITYIRDSE